MNWSSPDEGSSPLSSLPSSHPPSPSTSASELSEHSDSEFLEHSFAPRLSYPSPSCSGASSAKTSPAPDGMASPPASQDGDERPRKKRKLADPKERTTQRLDLRRDLTDADKPQLHRLLKTLHNKRKIVVIAGAGISVSAGIPDFRSSTGLFKSLRKEHKRISTGKDLFDASVYQDDSSTTSFHDMVRKLSQQTKDAKPTAFHHLLATLAHEGRLLRLYTQNVDGIDTSLAPLQTQVPLPKKTPWPKTVQLHGGLDHMVCSKCHTVSAFDADKFNGPNPPACPNCLETDSVRQVAEKRSHGIGKLRPRMVLYNEHNPDDEAIGSCVSADLRTRPDAVIVAGTTLKVPGVERIAREMCAIVRDRRDGVNIWINNDPEPVGKKFANLWDLVVQGPCDEVARHAAMGKWDDPVILDEIADDQVPKQQPTVLIQTPHKKVLNNLGQLTPVPSPRLVSLEVKNEHDNQPATQSKKTAGGKAKAKKEVKPNSVLTDTLKVKKSTMSNTKNAKNAQAKFMTKQPSQPSCENSATVLDIKIQDGPSTPQKRDAKVTAIREQYRHMAPISSSDPRNNQASGRPEIEPFTPAKRSPSEQLSEENLFFIRRPSTSEERPLSSSSRISIPNLMNPTEPSMALHTA